MRALLLTTLPLLALAACNSPAPAPSASDTPAATDSATPMATDSSTPSAMSSTPAAMASSPSAMASPMTSAPDAATYVAKAGASDMFEIASSKAILAKTKNADIMKFAHHMIAAHTKSTDMVKAAAMSAGMTPKPPMMDADQTAMLTAIKQASGKDADMLYITDQKKGHDAALALQSSYASGGDTPALKMAAGKIVPVVKSHIVMLDAMPAM